MKFHFLIYLFCYKEDQMNIQHLKYFTDIARYNSISKAALENHIAQPAMSRILKSIEEEYGTALFERKGRNIYLNQCGEILYEATRKSLSLLDGAKESMEIYNGKFKGSVKLALHTPTLQIPRICREFNEEYPQIFLDIQKPPYNPDTIYSMNYDLLILMGPLHYRSTYDSVLLGTSQVMAVVSELHPLAQRESLTIKDIEQYPMTVPILPGFREFVTAQCMCKNFVPEIIGVCENRTEHQILISSEPDRRIGVMLDSYAQTWKGTYVLIPFEDDFSVNFYISWNNQFPLRPSVELFRRFCIDSYEE